MLNASLKGRAEESPEARGPGPDMPLQRKVRNRLRRDIKRGTPAYIDALARTKRGAVDDALPDLCRVKAEHQMAHAMAHRGRSAGWTGRSAAGPLAPRWGCTNRCSTRSSVTVNLAYACSSTGRPAGACSPNAT